MIEIIAEIGVNWDNEKKLKSMILSAKKCGANMVKLQYYRAQDIKSHPLKKKLMPMVWTPEKAKKIIAYGKQHKITVFFTPENEECVDDLEEAENPIYKIGHNNYNNNALWKNIIYTGKYIICSLPPKAHKPVDMIFKYGSPRVLSNESWTRFLYCNPRYPTEDEDVNMPDFSCSYDGFSDHTKGIIASIIAASRGAKLIEVHYKVDEKCIDAAVSKTPKELKELVDNIRRIEKICKL